MSKRSARLLHSLQRRRKYAASRLHSLDREIQTLTEQMGKRGISIDFGSVEMMLVKHIKEDQEAVSKLYAHQKAAMDKLLNSENTMFTVNQLSQEIESDLNQYVASYVHENVSIGHIIRNVLHSRLHKLGEGLRKQTDLVMTLGATHRNLQTLLSSLRNGATAVWQPNGEWVYANQYQADMDAQLVHALAEIERVVGTELSINEALASNARQLQKLATMTDREAAA